MPMIPEVLSQELLTAIGGTVTKERKQAFDKLAQVIINHIKANMVVTSVGPGGTSISTLIV